jgi:hypothetical protein
LASSSTRGRRSRQIPRSAQELVVAVEGAAGGGRERREALLRRGEVGVLDSDPGDGGPAIAAVGARADGDVEAVLAQLGADALGGASSGNWR